MKVVSLLYRPPGEASAALDSLLSGQCWARFGAGFAAQEAGPVPPESEVLDVIWPMYRQCEDALPRPAGLTIALLPQGQDDDFSRFARQQMSGVSGLTAGADLIALRVGLEPGWQQALADAVAHEYHHAAWIALCPGTDRSTDLPLAELLAFEGRACLFARLMTGGWMAPWTLPLEAPAFEDRVWAAMSSGAPFVPGPDAPPWWVYQLGTAWVEWSLERRLELSMSEWTRLPARELLSEQWADERF